MKGSQTGGFHPEREREQKRLSWRNDASQGWDSAKSSEEAKVITWRRLAVPKLWPEGEGQVHGTKGAQAWAEQREGRRARTADLHFKRTLKGATLRRRRGTLNAYYQGKEVRLERLRGRQGWVEGAQFLGPCNCSVGFCDGKHMSSCIWPNLENIQQQEWTQMRSMDSG